jgi:hypothetical protein
MTKVILIQKSSKRLIEKLFVFYLSKICLISLLNSSSESINYLKYNYNSDTWSHDVSFNLLSPYWRENNPHENVVVLR